MGLQCFDTPLAHGGLAVTPLCPSLPLALHPRRSCFPLAPTRCISRQLGGDLGALLVDAVVGQVDAALPEQTGIGKEGTLIAYGEQLGGDLGAFFVDAVVGQVDTALPEQTGIWKEGTLIYVREGQISVREV